MGVNTKKKISTCSCFFSNDSRGNERWQNVQVYGTDMAELAVITAFESPSDFAGKTWPSVGGIAGRRLT